MGDPYPGKIKYAGGERVQLTYEEVAACLGLAGWPESLWPKAGAVISAESDRIANIYNTYLQGHFGLMQIGQQQHADFFKGNSSNWIDPVANCKEGYAIYQVQGWGAWESATNGRFTGSLLQATAAAQAVQARVKAGQLAPGAMLNPGGKSADGWAVGTTPHAGPYSRDEVLNSYLMLKKDDVLAQLQAAALGAGARGVVEELAAAGTKAADVTVAAGQAAAETTAAMQSNAIFGFVEMMVGAGKWISDPSNWIRVAQVFAGGALLVAGIAIVAKPVTGALPVGKIAKVLK